MITLLVAHGVLGAVLFPTGARLGRWVFLAAALAPLATLVWLLAQLGDVEGGRILTAHLDWVPELGIGVDLRLDGFAALMVLLVAGIGVAVCVYAAGYFEPASPSNGRNAGLLVMFAGAMLCLVLADDLLVMYAGWELTAVISYLLIGNDHLKPQARAAALHALLVTSLGGLAMLAGFVLVGQAAGTFRLSEIVADPPRGAGVTAGVVLVLVGAFTKSAQYPFHSWLPGAMAAPTPISAYLHSATMVKAGVYLIGRMAPPFAAIGMWRPVVVTVGLVTMIAGGARALRQTDLKLLLAFGTVSQLGLLVVLFGFGNPEVMAAGCAMVLAHAVFKAALFMAVGVVDHRLGTRDLRQLPVLGREWGAFVVLIAVAGASMAGIPLAFGFVAKESALQALLDTGGTAAGIALAGIVAGSLLTVAYTLRFLAGIAGRLGERAPAPPASAAPFGFTAPLLALSALTLVGGVAPGVADGVAGAASRSLGLDHAAHLAVWHGFNVALLLSAAVVAGGVALFLLRHPVDLLLGLGSRLPSGLDAYAAVLRGTNRIATRVTGVVQSGSLPTYAGVTLLTAALVPGTVLVTGIVWPGWPTWIGAWAQLPVVVVLLGAAIAAAIVRRRFSAALFLGTAGYAMAALFVVQGAPDLALTQVAIETLSTVLFVLVLRRLPDRFERTSTNRRRAVRLLVSGAVGVAVFVFAIVSRGARTDIPVSAEMSERALPDAHGRNVVNVILVDIRGLDTLGEITVLTAAAIGAVALARVGKRRRASCDEVTT